MHTIRKSFSLLGVPVLGIMGLMLCLWHPQAHWQPEALGPQTVFLVDASPKLDRAMTIFLRQEAKNVAESRCRRSLKAQAQTVAEYNVIAQECTPDVFAQTHLPPRM